MGVRASVGGATVSPVAFRKHYGATYWYSYYDNSYSGWETRDGSQTSANIPILGFPVSYSSTKITSGDKSQYVHGLSAGVPGLGGTFENDGRGAMISEEFGNGLAQLPGHETGESDAWRTAAVKVDISFALFLIGLPVVVPGATFGTNLYTGNPENSQGVKEFEERADGKDYYCGGTADQYRAGVFWVGAGPFKLGVNSEGVRNAFQNELIHDPKGIPRFTVLKRKPELYFYFGSGTGSTLW